ncbi:MAG: ATP-dependent RecD-like DNA helicase [Dethiobacter sp.]|nr:ATP-dependent RecD-like DNA helicase [Dethiobacter sp.]
MEQADGILEKIRYYNSESCYLVGILRCRAGGQITFVGNFPQLTEGESLSITGQWQLHPRFGQQLVVENWERLIPATVDGLTRYLSSGLIKGVGPVMAKRIVRHLGLSTLEILEKEPHRLQEVEGIGSKKSKQIINSFRNYKQLQNVMVFLQSYGIGVGNSMRLYRQFGAQTIDRVKENPYRLADEVFGIGFKTADQIACRMGLPEDSPERVKAAIVFALNQASNQGHVFLPREQLFEKVQELLGLSPAQSHLCQLDLQLQALEHEKRIYLDQCPAGVVVYYAPFYYAELGVARRLKQMVSASQQWTEREAKEALDRAAGRSATRLVAEQIQVLEQSLTAGVLVITGGPGTGKTTTIKALLSLFHSLKQKVLLAAPTGRAAKRVTEATGEEAFTIHRLLEYSFTESEGFKFQRHEDNPVEARVIIIDEASMVDLLLMFNLVKAIPEGCRLIIVGDVDQLPAVGAGNVLKDLINSGTVPFVRLLHIFRQARESMIIVNAHRINQGEMPLLNKKDKDFFFIAEEEPERVAALVVELCLERIPGYGPYDPLRDIQVITPMRRTEAGVERLNVLLQKAINPKGRHKPEINVKGTVFRLGDKVMQVRNNYQKEVYNGDIGMVAELDLEAGELVVTFRESSTDRLVQYDFSELDELVLSYAVSVHKSQGSEYPVVIMPVITQHYLLLQRNLLYTGITRARKMAVLVGTKKALAIAVHNNKAENRFSYLDGRLQDVCFAGS